MDEGFVFNAPRFFDFRTQLDVEDRGNVEAYFEMDHENLQIKQPEIDTKLAPPNETQRKSLRKSLSAGNLLVTHNQGDGHTTVHNVSASNLQAAFTNYKERKSGRPMIRFASRENLDKLAQPKLCQNGQVPKFVSLSEAINKFYNKTPERFHSKPKDCQFAPKVCNALASTMPQSPTLATKNRVRKEAEEKEGYKKYKIKANPINPKVLQGPVKPIHIQKKPNTVIEPFNLTRAQNKKEVKAVEPETAKFHANPVPKSVSGKPKLVVKANTPRTLRLSSQLRPEGKIEPETGTLKINGVQKPFKPTRTLLTPSFEQRNLNLMKKRQESLNKKSEKGTSVEAAVFKARPATVLYKKPFEPKKMGKPLIEVTGFHVNMDRQVKERQKFDQQQKQKGDKAIELKKRAEEEHGQREQVKAADQQQRAEYKPKRNSQFKDIKVIPSRKVTVPISPHLNSD